MKEQEGRSLRVLALNPYSGGSHTAFFDGWRARSHHDWTILELPGWNWKWRMRTAAIDLAERVTELWASGSRWDVVLCTDMMNAAEFRGLLPGAVARLPLVVYFHENQAAYPLAPGRDTDDRDVHFLLTNVVSVLGADEAWFNSAYNLRTLTEGIRRLEAAVPGAGAVPALTARIEARSRVEHPGVDDALFELDRGAREPGPLRILWAARWEFDKRPDVFAAALERLASDGVDFTVDLIGQGRGDSEGGGVFDGLSRSLGARVGRFGHAETREEYVRALCEADVVVSTAEHEFFGLSIVEAAATGAAVIAPEALAYPEVLGSGWVRFHDGTVEGVHGALRELAEAQDQVGHVSEGEPAGGRPAVDRFRWSERAARLDEGLARVGASDSGGG